jgi:hypothetical protein
MSLLLSGTNGLSDVDGSAATPAIRGTDANTGIYFPGADRIGFAEGGVQVGEFDASGNFQMNSGYGSVAVAYACRAWVNFNGTGPVAIRASGNVSSITDNGTGDYTVNFTTAMADANYSSVCTGIVAADQGSTYGFGTLIPSGSIGQSATLKSTTQYRVLSRRDSNVDIAELNVAVFR